MYSDAVRRRALLRLAGGATLSQVSRELTISRAALRDWRDYPDRSDHHARAARCPVCGPDTPMPQASYAHLLGAYLGDGCLSRTRHGTYALRISCDASYRLIIDDTRRSILAVHPGRSVFEVPAPGCIVVQSSWKHWLCLFPQHGAGRKHERRIELADWQQAIADSNPEPLLRGLFHSDGCRSQNWTVRPLKAGPKRYEYTRYLFSNESSDIIGICTRALDILDIHWTLPRRNMVSVARRVDVATLDTFVGPKF